MKIRAAMFVLAAFAWTISAPVTAQTTQADGSNARPARDPNQRICEDITQVGSRLATKRICATRSEWEAMRKADRENVDAIQRNPCILDVNGQCGSH